MRHHPSSFLACCACLAAWFGGTAHAAAAAAAAPASGDAPPQGEIKTLMCDRGKLLFEDDFPADTLGKNWGDAKSEGFAFEGSAMRVTALPGVHPPMRFHGLAADDVIVQVDLKLDGVDWLSLGWDSKQAPSPGHMERFSLRAESWEDHREGKLGTDRSKDTIDKMNTKIEIGVWHTLVWEIHGTERLASLDKTKVLYGQADGIDIPKSSLWLETSSNPGKYAWFAHLKVWQATLKPDWEKKGKAQVLEYLKKRS
jgi:hypothetical protein